MNVSRLFPALLAAAAMTSVTVTMAPQNGSNETGTTTLTQEGKDVQVVIQLDNAAKGDQPAHIHAGTCANLGDPKYPLNNVVNGKSTTVIKNATVSDLTSGAFAVNVHKSTDDLKTYVSCGDIKAATPAPAASSSRVAGNPVGDPGLSSVR